MTELMRFPGAARRDPTVEAWFGDTDNVLRHVKLRCGGSPRTPKRSAG